MNTTIKLAAIVLLSASSAFAKDSKFVIKCVIGDLALPPVLAEASQQVVLRSVREVRFPTEWDLPNLPRESADSDGVKELIPVSPVTPLTFEMVESGWIIKCTAERIEGGLIRVVGIATFTDLDFKQAVHGEHSGPIYHKKILMTENKGPSAIVHSSSTHFQVFALPGKQYKFKVARLNKNVPLTLTCDYKQ